MLVALASDRGTWLGGCVTNMPGAGVDGNDGLMGTRKAPIAGRARTEVEGTCCFVAAGADSCEVFVDGLMGMSMVMVSPVEKIVDLVPIGGGQGE